MGRSRVSTQDRCAWHYFCAPANAPISGPRGLLAPGGELVVVNQNAETIFSGEIQQYLLKTASFAGFLVAGTDPGAPLAPRGAILRNGVFYVANFTANDADPPAPGAIYVFSGNGTSLGIISPPAPLNSQFFPRAIVLNPRDRTSLRVELSELHQRQRAGRRRAGVEV